MSVSHSAPLDCENLVRPLDQLDLQSLEGRWALVGDSVKNAENEKILKQKDSVTIYFHNSTYIQSDRHAENCQYDSHNVSIEGNHFNAQTQNYNFSGTFFHTSCSDCVLFRLDVVSPVYMPLDLILVSRRRELEPKEMEEFRAQVECLKMPPPIVMDPTKELCPKQATSSSTSR
ncbi:hypothetical protein PAMP_020924 [Pampus punctatissimus]